MGGGVSSMIRTLLTLRGGSKHFWLLPQKLLWLQSFWLHPTYEAAGNDKNQRVKKRKRRMESEHSFWKTYPKVKTFNTTLLNWVSEQNHLYTLWEARSNAIALLTLPSWQSSSIFCLYYLLYWLQTDPFSADTTENTFPPPPIPRLTLYCSKTFLWNLQEVMQKEFRDKAQSVCLQGIIF